VLPLAGNDKTDKNFVDPQKPCDHKMKRKCGDTANRLNHNTFEGLHTLQMFKKTTEKGIEKLNIFHTSPLPCNYIDHCSKSCNLRYQYPCEISTYLASSLDDMDNSMLCEFACQSLINFHTSENHLLSLKNYSASEFYPTTNAHDI
jgi:hypothetical protein